jgi:hypothetical protein
MLEELFTTTPPTPLELEPPATLALLLVELLGLLLGELLGLLLGELLGLLLGELLGLLLGELLGLLLGELLGLLLVELLRLLLDKLLGLLSPPPKLLLEAMSPGLVPAGQISIILLSGQSTLAVSVIMKQPPSRQPWPSSVKPSQGPQLQNITSVKTSSQLSTTLP